MVGAVPFATTVKAALAVFVGSTTLVAVTVKLPMVVAENRPDPLMDPPPFTDQVTPLFAAPLTVVENCKVLPACTLFAPPGVLIAPTLTADTARLMVPVTVGSCVLAAVTDTWVPLPGIGAVYMAPDALGTTDPALAVQVNPGVVAVEGPLQNWMVSNVAAAPALQSPAEPPPITTVSTAFVAPVGALPVTPIRVRLALLLTWGVPSANPDPYPSPVAVSESNRKLMIALPFVMFDVAT
jgi:hypothetical protein